MNHINTILVVTVILFSITACQSLSTSESTASVESAIDKQLKQIISTRHLTGNAMQGRQTPDIASPEAQLGMRLFFSKSLGGDKSVACATCHHPALGGGDNLSLSVGVAAERPNLLGEGRLVDANSQLNGVPSVPRNAPTTFNVAAWDEVLFYDGRIESLGKTPASGGNDQQGIRTPEVAFGERDFNASDNLVNAQARFPLTSATEMKGFGHGEKTNQEIRDYIASRIGNYADNQGELVVPSYWLEQFQQVYQAPNASAKALITEKNIASLISHYERSQVFTNTPWRRYIEGDKTAISESAKAGAVLFYTSDEKGGANCSSCHRGDFFTDEKFHNIATPQIGKGKGDGVDGSADFGRFRETGIEADKYRFRTPTLLNVEVTGPWSHAGAYANLDSMIWHHLDARNEVTNYNTNQLVQPNITNIDKMQENMQLVLQKLDEARDAGLTVLQNIDLKGNQVTQLVDFLHTLTDPCVKNAACLAKWIPAENEDPNGHQLDGIDIDGDSL